MARTPEVDRACGGSFKSVLSDFAARLAGRDDVRNVVVTSICPRDLTDADVFVFVARVDACGLESTAREALAAWSQSSFLMGKVAFCILLGDGAADFGSQYNLVSAAISRSGATNFAPALALVIGQPGHKLAVAKYCEHWAPVVPALRQLAASGIRKGVAA
ncbi:hypothetical protein [Mycolicibacterium setense]